MAVAEGDEMVECLLSGHRIVARHGGEVEPRGCGVDEDDRQVALGEARIVPVRGILLGVHPPGENHPRHLLVEQQVDVGRLREPPDGARAQHRGEALLGERSADDVGDRGEDRVLQLGQDEPDESRPLPAQLCRSLVAEDIERGEDRLPCRLGDAWALIEHATDGRLAHADVPGNLGKPSAHARKPRTSGCKNLQEPSVSARKPSAGMHAYTDGLAQVRVSSLTRNVMTRASSRQAS